MTRNVERKGEQIREVYRIMNSRKKKIITLVLCCVMMCMCITGCGAKSKSSSAKIKVNVWKSSMTLSNVTYYDFYNNEKISNYSGKCYAMSNSLTSTTISFSDEEGETRMACVDKPLADRPSEVKVYTSADKTNYETYKCE